jgi:esterase/lipase superfamily enzyme
MDAAVLGEVFGDVAKCLRQFRIFLARYEEKEDSQDERDFSEYCTDCIACLDRGNERLLAQIEQFNSLFMLERSSDRDLWDERLVKYASKDISYIASLISDLSEAFTALQTAQNRNLIDVYVRIGYSTSILTAARFAKDTIGAYETRFAALGRLYSRANSPEDIVPGEDHEIDSAIAFYNFFRDSISFEPARGRQATPKKTEPVASGARPFRIASRLVPVFFATDRAKISDSHPLRLKFSNGRRIGDLVFGIAEVSIPRGHKRGRVERPSLWKLQFQENPDRHIVITSCVEKTRSDWQVMAQRRIEDAGESTALLFIHGFNVTFDEAIRNAGQIGWDLNFEGLIIGFSWCSEGEVLNYFADESNARLCAPKLATFLTFLRDKIRLKSINIIAHSMGNLLLIEALRRMKRRSIVDEVVLAAPDYDADEFRSAIGELSRKARRYTLYGSDKDRALTVSKKIRKDYPRAGDGGANLLVTEGVDSIDASLIGEDLLGLGHSYFSARRTVLSDIYYLIKYSFPASRRDGLSEVVSGRMKYWIFQP